MKAHYRMEGVMGLKQALEQGGKDIQKRVSRALEQTAKNVQRTAQRLAPRETGALARAIQYTGKGLNWRVGIDDAQLAGRGGSSAHQYPSVYGVWYELGFVTRNIQAHPFMKPAADAEEQAHVARTEAAINAAVGDMG